MITRSTLLRATALAACLALGGIAPAMAGSDNQANEAAAVTMPRGVPSTDGAPVQLVTCQHAASRTEPQGQGASDLDATADNVAGDTGCGALLQFAQRAAPRQ
jgi:hypothetical protein